MADNDEAPATLHVSRVDGCSSLRTQHNRSVLAAGDWTDPSMEWVASGCSDVVEERSVPTISLRTLLRTWLGGRPVEFMHIDVQGGELGVLRSAGPEAIRQVERIQLELPNPRCITLTQGAPTCDEVLATLTHLGFVTEAQASSLDEVSLCS